MASKFRPGAVGAMMDEYERAAAELKDLVHGLTDEQYAALADPDTKDEDCRTIQTIMRHVVGAGYGYANYLRGHFGDPQVTHDNVLASREDCLRRFDEMMAFTVRTLENRWQLPDKEIDGAQIHVRWGPVFNIEQLMEHAIVHLLRHRRQIEKLLLRMSGEPV